MAHRGASLVALGVFATALWAQNTAPVGSLFDDANYVVLAKALAEGQGYRNIHLPDAPPGVHYPPLYPAALSLLWRLWPSFPENVVLFRLFDAAALAAAAGVLASTVRRLPVRAGAGFLAVFLGFTAPPLLTIVGVRFPEPLFLLLVVAAALVADGERATAGSAAAAGALAGLAALTRSLGLAVVAAIPLALWLRHERRAAVVALATALAVLAPWFAWTAAQAGAVDPRIASGYGTYLSEAGEVGWGVILRGLDLRALGPITRLALPAAPAPLWYPLVLLFLAVVGWGAVRLARWAPALVATVPLYLLFVSLWPYPPDRFMWVMLPFAALFLCAGAGAALASGRWGRGAVAVLAVALLAGYGLATVRAVAGRDFARMVEEGGRPLRLLTPAVAAGTPDSAVVAAEAEAAMFLHSGRLAVPGHLFRRRGLGSVPLPPDSNVRYFCDAGVTHVVRAESGGEAGLPQPAVEPLFAVQHGPELYRFQCPG